MIGRHREIRLSAGVDGQLCKPNACQMTRGTYFDSTRYAVMRKSLSSDPKKKISETEELIARTEERVRKIQARAEPGAARMLQGLTNSIRKHRRDLQKLMAGHPTIQTQQLRQQRLMQQAQRDAPDRSGPLPAKQDQEPRRPVPQQGATEGQ